MTKAQAYVMQDRVKKVRGIIFKEFFSSVKLVKGRAIDIRDDIVCVI